MEKLTALCIQRQLYTVGKYKKLLKETKRIHENSKANMKANKYYTTLETRNILALIHDLKLTQMANPSISYNTACQNSIRIFLRLEQS